MAFDRMSCVCNLAGTEQEQDEKQSRVLNCVIEFAYFVMNMEGYSGPLLDVSLFNAYFAVAPALSHKLIQIGG